MRPTRPARQPRLMRRQNVLAGIALYAIARLPFDRRFLVNVITLAIALGAAKELSKESAHHSVERLRSWAESNYQREQRQQLPAAK